MRGEVLDLIASIVANFYEIAVDDISLKGKQKKRVKSVQTCANLCPIHEATGVGYSVERGEIIARENDYQLTEYDSENFKGIPLDETPYKIFRLQFRFARYEN